MINDFFPTLNTLQLVDAGTFLSLMDEKGHLRYDIRCPDGDLGDALRTKLASNTDEALAVSCISVTIAHNYTQ